MKRKQGFTLIEMLGIITVLGVILLVTFPVMTASLKKLKETTTTSIKNKIKIGAEAYAGLHDFDNELEITVQDLYDAQLIKGSQEGINPSQKIKIMKNEDGILEIYLDIASTVYTYSTVGATSLTIPTTGTYKIELWGAGNAASYTSGEIDLNASSNLYIYVGGVGTDCSPYTSCDGLGYNGGASGGYFTASNFSKRYGRSGGATDVRLVNGAWDNFDSLKSRIMVAAGSGGTYIATAAGGGLSGYNGGGSYSPGGGASQIAGGSASNGAQAGMFGSGGYGYINYPNEPNNNSATGGSGGYYGGGGGAGGTATGSGNNSGSGGSGSSFISGYYGCNAIAESSTSTNIVHTNQPNHYSGKVFTNGVMIDGKGCDWSTGSATNCGANQPQPDGTMAEGHDGNGYAKITLIGEKL